MRYEVHSDGSSARKSDLPGGWAFILVELTGDQHRIVGTDFGSDPVTSNNRMEFTGAIRGLRALSRIWKPGDQVTLISDSQLTLGMASGRFSPSKNHDLVDELRELMVAMGVQDRWVPGHTLKKYGDWRQAPRDVLLNNRCDQLATAAKARLKQALATTAS
jgi:ribonuclease HI